jgi:hypothetical protein
MLAVGPFVAREAPPRPISNPTTIAAGMALLVALRVSYLLFVRTFWLNHRKLAIALRNVT